LLECDRGKFREALVRLSASHEPWSTIDMTQVESADPGPIKELFEVWREMYGRGGPPFIDAPDHVWRMLGEAAIKVGMLGQAGDKGTPRD
jgi:hypothetical protein